MPIPVTTVFLVALPLCYIPAALFDISGDTLTSLMRTVLPRYLVNTFIVTAGTGALALLLGVAPAWCVTMYRFPGRRILEWVLILPFAVPTYLAAIAYVELFSYTGPVQRIFRNILGWARYPVPDVMSPIGVIVVLASVLYPYVYLPARTVFTGPAVQAFEVARGLGHRPAGAFFRGALPLARPALSAGVALVVMEVLAEYGAVHYYGIDTLTVGVFRTWFSRGDRSSATALSALLLLLAFGALAWERRQRKRARFDSFLANPPTTRTTLPGRWKWPVLIVCSVPVFLGFLLPVGQLIGGAVARLPDLSYRDLERFGYAIRDTLVLSVSGTVLTAVTALFLAYTARIRTSAPMERAIRFGTVGYAVPGAVIALGIMAPLGWLDHRLIAFSRALFGFSPGLIFSGTLFALLWAVIVRFLAVGFHPLASGLEGVSGRLDEVSRSLGHGPGETLRRVVLPMLREPLTAVGMLLFLDILKELPLTLILRPFNFHTLAIRAYNLANDERFLESAPYALAVVLLSLVPVFVIIALQRRRSR